MYFDVSISTAFVGTLIMSILPQLREDLQRLTAPGADIAQMYADITRNTAKPLTIPSDMLASDFHTLLTGSNLRWETLGLILVVSASNAQFTDPMDPIFTLEDGRKIDKEEFIEDVIHAANDCVTLCQVHGAVNDIMAWFVYGNMFIVSNFYGDNCSFELYLIWYSTHEI